MARRKHRSIAPRAAEAAERIVPPTRETVAKLRRDVVAGLYRQGRLRSEHLHAAREIRNMWEAFGRVLFPSAQNPRMFRQSHRRGEYNDPIARLSRAEEAAWRARYRPWADEMTHEVVAASARITRLQLVIDVVVDNHGIRELEGAYRMRHGVAFPYLRGALHRYCEIAGWVGPSGPSR